MNSTMTKLTRAQCIDALRRIDFILHDAMALPRETVDQITDVMRPIRNSLYPYDKAWNTDAPRSDRHPD
jgi:hypothetical protein